MSVFESAPLFPKDAIFALTAQYNHDPSPVKVNLGQGSYRDGTGLPWVLPSVRESRRRLSGGQKLHHEYLPILGLPEFRSAVGKTLLGAQAHIAIESKLAVSQSLSGTGSLHLAGTLLRDYSGLTHQVLLSEPTWSNHHLIFSSLGFEVRTFRYYDATTGSLDWKSYADALHAAEPKSIVVLHACAHNPTGCDPTREQWTEIGRIIKAKSLFPLFDAAYLGFRSGNFDEDAFSIRHFVNDLGLEAAVAVSFAKNMGLYEISNPPAYGAKVATQILSDESLRSMWFEDLETMSTRIGTMRQSLCDLLVKSGTSI
ncbi:Aspartate aminotransferase, cytoplasmic [Knufia peltigerae]|uniref:Aspartate aminotransferase, cytoplasmic n=1 Tax=Knufia peltigerae TaxID=1002370 RepID=A0AA38YBJ5_9EURO|nr:Aspartate aminotransferase, cytoplasmic [Knufia peltigerae]